MSKGALAYLGLDVGTASTKGVLVSLGGKVLATATRTHRVVSPSAGHVEIDPELVWRELVDIVEELTTSAASSVLAISISAMGPCVILTDQDDRVLGPAILYGVDTRNSVQNRRLTRELGSDRIRDISGNVLSSQSAGSKLAWLREARPNLWRAATRFHSLAGFLVYRMTGEYVMDHHTASQFDPLYDVDGSQWWDAGVRAVLGDSDIQLPALSWSDAIVGSLHFPLGTIDGGVPVTAGIVDAWAEAISVGADADGELMLMYGSTMFLIVNSTSRHSAEGLWSTRAANSTSFSLAGGTATSGAVTQWWSDVLGEPDFGRLNAEASVVAAGSDGLITLPYFAGERTPFFDPDARGLIAGLTIRHSRGALYRSALEATGFAVRHNLSHFNEASVDVIRGTVVGGGAQGDFWPQIVSDITGVPQVVRMSSVGAAYGNAVLGARALDHEPNIDLWNPVKRQIDPNPSSSHLYDELFHHYLNLHEITRPAMHHLAELQRTPNE